MIVENLRYPNLHNNHGSKSLCRDCYVERHPIRFHVPNRLVYSGHIYEWDTQYTHNSYSDYALGVQQYQNYVTTPNRSFTAPFWLGEFGTNVQNRYWNQTIRLLRNQTSIGWAYWAIDGYKHSGGNGDDESFGIFEQDYHTIRHPWKVHDLQTVQPPREAVRTIAVHT